MLAHGVLAATSAYQTIVNRFINESSHRRDKHKCQLKLPTDLFSSDAVFQVRDRFSCGYAAVERI